VCVCVCVCVCKSAIALYLHRLRELVTKVLINPIIRTRTRHFRRAYHPTRDSMYIRGVVRMKRKADRFYPWVS
jgi:hypothetical protein